MNPPKHAAIASTGSQGAGLHPALNSPARPATELSRTNSEAVAAVRLVSAQLSISITGLRKMPPPVPVSPAMRPTTIPTVIATSGSGGTGEAPDAGARTATQTIRQAVNMRTTPIATFNACVGRSTRPPT